MNQVASLPRAEAGFSRAPVPSRPGVRARKHETHTATGLSECQSRLAL